ncbi:hypothetical protein K0M31_018780, partial [Melipona bicolor]
ITPIAEQNTKGTLQVRFVNHKWPNRPIYNFPPFHKNLQSISQVNLKFRIAISAGSWNLKGAKSREKYSRKPSFPVASADSSVVGDNISDRSRRERRKRRRVTIENARLGRATTRNAMEPNTKGTTKAEFPRGLADRATPPLRIAHGGFKYT